MRVFATPAFVRTFVLGVMCAALMTACGGAKPDGVDAGGGGGGGTGGGGGGEVLDSGTEDAGVDAGIPELTIQDSAAQEGQSGTATINFAVSLSKPSDTEVTVAWATSDGTASATNGGTDYVASSGTLTFPAGETTAQVSVTVNGDTLDEDDETFSVTLSNPTNAILASDTARGTIQNDDTSPNLSVSGSSVSEGDTGTTSLDFTVTLDTASGRQVTVDYATSDATANEGSDYTAATGTLVFAPGETTKTVSIAVLPDTTEEPDETVMLTLSNAVSAAITSPSALGTIQNDDAPAIPTLSVSDATVTEGAGNTDATLTFTVTLSTAAAQDVTVDYATADGTAVVGGQSAAGGNDYASTNGTLTFAAGETSKTVSITVHGDDTDEADETFELDLSNASTAAVIADAQGVGTITDDDAAPTISIDSPSLAEGASGLQSLTFTVSLTNTTQSTATVEYATADGTATSGGSATSGGGDYITAAGTLSFNPGTTSQQITVIVNGDRLNELDETLTLTLTNPTNGTLGTAVGTGTITNDDALPVISAQSAQANEGNSGNSALTFTVSLDAASGQSVTVAYATSGGNATAGTDYQSASGTLTFNPGVTTQAVTVQVIGDTATEGNETFDLVLSSPTNATISSATAVGTILNDDGAAPKLNISSATVTEGNSGSTNATLTVTLSAAATQTVTVSYATSKVTAIGGADYQNTAGTLSFAPGITSQTLSIPVFGDALDEDNETFEVKLSGPQNADIQNGTGTVTITDDDALPSLTITGTSVSEGNSGSTTATFTVTLSAASGRTVTANFASANGSALAGGTAVGSNDYVAQSGVLTFNAGETSKDIAITVNGDLLNEPNETFTVTLSAPTNATLGTASATGTINNDDQAPTLSIANASKIEGSSFSTTPLTFTVTLSAASAQTITVQYATANGTATSPGDYFSANGTLTFNPGETSKTLNVSVVGDITVEPDETFKVNLSAPTNATVANAVGTGTIVNDD